MSLMAWRLRAIAATCAGLACPACSRGGPCGAGGGNNNSFDIAAVVSVVEPSGAPIRTATVSISGTALNGGCGTYEIAGRGGYEVEVFVAAPGYNTTHRSIFLPDTCMSSSQLQVVVSLIPACSHPFVHTDGLGDTWSDCTPLDSLTPDEVALACQVDECQSIACVGTACSDDTGVGSDAGVLCATGSAEGPCTCWGYAGAGAGHVRKTAEYKGCICPTAADPQWH